jgi:hypothetical protein
MFLSTVLQFCKNNEFSLIFVLSTRNMGKFSWRIEKSLPIFIFSHSTTHTMKSKYRQHYMYI